MIRVLEVDQWTSTGNIREHKWADLERRGIAAIEGGDSAAAKAIFGGRFVFRSVEECKGPALGSVWFRKGTDGYPVLYLANYDSSD